jgi:hypothetical protein
MSGRRERPIRRVLGLTATVRPAMDMDPRRGVSTTRGIRRLGAGTRHGRHSGRRQATSAQPTLVTDRPTLVTGQPTLVTGRASAATGRLVPAIRIGMGRGAVTGLVTGTGLTLATVRPTTDSSPDTAQGPLRAGRFRHLAMALDTVRRLRSRKP